MRDVEAITASVLAAVVGVLISRIYAARGIVSSIAFSQSLAVRIGQACCKSMGVTLLRLYLQCVIACVGETIQIADISQQPRDVAFAPADVSLVWPAAIEVRIR